MCSAWRATIAGRTRTSTALPTSCPRRSDSRERGALFGLDPQDAQPLVVGRRYLDEPLCRCAARRRVASLNSVSLYPDWQNLKAERKTLRSDNHRLGGQRRRRLARGRSDILFRRDQARMDTADAGCSSPTCSITRPITAVRCIACSPRLAAGRAIPICRSCRSSGNEPATMTDTAQLEQSILAEIAAAGDEAALEAVRVAALGKTGSVTALLKTLGTLAPEERKSQGPLINGLKDRVNAALGARRDAFKGSALGGASQYRKHRCYACRCARRPPRSAACIRSPR